MALQDDGTFLVETADDVRKVLGEMGTPPDVIEEIAAEWPDEEGARKKREEREKALKEAAAQLAERERYNNFEYTDKDRKDVRRLFKKYLPEGKSYDDVTDQAIRRRIIEEVRERHYLREMPFYKRVAVCIKNFFMHTLPVKIDVLCYRLGLPMRKPKEYPRIIL